jgi:RNA chaperone Hfq
MNTDEFIENLIDERKPVECFLSNGVRLAGTITGMDEDSLFLTKEGVTQLVLIHSLATILPK